MSNQVDTAFAQGYKSAIEIQYQQKGSRLRPLVRVETQNVEFDFYDRIGSVSATKLTTRHADTPQTDTPHSRRRVGMEDYVFNDFVDKKDKLRMLSDPTSSYVMNAVMAMGRAIDDAIISAATGTAYSGKTGSTSVTFPAGSEVAVNYVESGAAANSNLTIGKLRRARFLLDSTEASEGNLFAVVSASQIQALLRTTETTSSDFNTVKALVAGEIDTFLGFKFVRTERLTVAANIRDCLFFERGGLLLAVGDDIQANVDVRPDKNYTTQTYVRMSIGATRMWEEKVIRVKCDETV